MSLIVLVWPAVSAALLVVIHAHLCGKMPLKAERIKKTWLTQLGFVLVTTPLAFPQAPQITDAGVVNAASYAQPVAPGSVVTIFGTNLASAPARADQKQLPTNLAGTSVTIDGTLAPLFYVSPGQINAQVPSKTAWGPQFPTATVVVTTAVGSSKPVQVPVNEEALGVFTTDASGCGRGAVFNVAPDGSISLNGPQNSAEPGSFLTIFATGLGATSFDVPDGMPAPLSPLTKPFYTGIHAFIGDLSSVGDGLWYVPFAGRAPLEVGIDQFNVQLNLNLVPLEGCAIPLRIVGAFSQSQPAPVAIHHGGGQCVDPPANSYGVLRWKKVVTSGAINTTTETFSAEFPAAPWIHLPALPELLGPYVEAPLPPPGPVCRWAEPVSDAGTLTVHGTAFGPLSVPRDATGRYLVNLPAGSIQPGTFTVTSQGAGVGAFTTSVRIPEPIQLTTTFTAGLRAKIDPLTIGWRGGDAQSLVDVQIVSTSAGRYLEAVVAASDGSVSFWPSGYVSNGLGGESPVFPLTGTVDIVIRQIAPASQVVAFPAQGLTLGGRHLWTYEFHITGVTL